MRFAPLFGVALVLLAEDVDVSLEGSVGVASIADDPEFVGALSSSGADDPFVTEPVSSTTCFP
jgi:hypothetical protein